jgi:hypothetical protein
VPQELESSLFSLLKAVHCGLVSTRESFQERVKIREVLLISLGCELGFIFVQDALFADCLQGFNNFATLERKHGVFNLEVRFLGVFLLDVVEVTAVQDSAFQLSKLDKCLSSTI